MLKVHNYLCIIPGNVQIGITMSWTNYHSHCHYCDGKMPPEAYIEAAIQQGVKIYGFSSHCPVPFENTWSMQDEFFYAYLKEIEQLKSRFEDKIELYKSLEIDYIPGMISPVSEIIQQADLDYTIGSVHFVGAFEDHLPWEIDGTTSVFQKGMDEIYDGDIRKVISKYFALTREMTEKACPDIIGHLDKIRMHNAARPFFDENAEWYRKEIGQTLEVIRDQDAIVEVNTRGLYKNKTTEPYPDFSTLALIRDMQIPVCLNSDAHHPDEITSTFRETAQKLKSIGFKTLRIYHQHEWVDLPFDEGGVKL